MTTVDNKFSGFVTKIKNDYATNASLDSRLNDLKAQHISTEVKKIDDKIKKNASDILAFETRLKQKEGTVDESQREDSFTRGLFYYIDQSYLVYGCKRNSFSFNTKRITVWKSTGIYNYAGGSNMGATTGANNNLPDLKSDGRMHVYFNGNYLLKIK